MVWDDGEEEYLANGATAGQGDSIFTSRKQAQEMVDFMKIGMDGYQIAWMDAQPTTSGICSASGKKKSLG